MPKIKNMKLARKTVSISSETVKFNTEGIGEIKSEAIYEDVKNLANFYEVPENKKSSDDKDTAEDKSKKEETKKDEVKKDTKSSTKKK